MAPGWGGKLIGNYILIPLESLVCDIHDILVKTRNLRRGRTDKVFFFITTAMTGLSDVELFFAQ